MKDEELVTYEVGGTTLKFRVKSYEDKSLSNITIVLNTNALNVIISPNRVKIRKNLLFCKSKIGLREG